MVNYCSFSSPRRRFIRDRRIAPSLQPITSSPRGTVFRTRSAKCCRNDSAVDCRKSARFDLVRGALVFDFRALDYFCDCDNGGKTVRFQKYDSGKLPKSVLPIEYSIRIVPNIDKRTFNGTETMKLETRTAVRELVLNAADIEISTVDGR